MARSRRESEFGLTTAGGDAAGARAIIRQMPDPARPEALDSDDLVLEDLEAALFETSLGRLVATGNVYPLGGFLLAGAKIDMLAGLAYDPQNDGDGKQGERTRSSSADSSRRATGKTRLARRCGLGCGVGLSTMSRPAR